MILLPLFKKYSNLNITLIIKNLSMKQLVWLFMSAMALSFVVSCDKDDEEKIDNSPIIEFKDPLVLQALLNPNFNVFDKNGDGRISQKEANDVNVDVGECFVNRGIRSFDEISYFQNMKKFILNLNKLTSLDISKNTKLLYLECEANQLNNLNLNNNIEVLYCGSNQLTILNVSKCLSLSSLWCRNNLLASIDVSKNPELGGLYCSNNKLTSLDLSKNPELTSLDCSNNQLTMLDLSKNKLLGKNVYSKINIDGNPLKKLIISKYHILPDSFIDKYKGIIEYVE